MKDAANHYFVYGILTTAIWIALNALGLLSRNPHDSWLRDLSTIWLRGLSAEATRQMFFKSPPELTPATLPRPQPKHACRAVYVDFVVVYLEGPKRLIVAVI